MRLSKEAVRKAVERLGRVGLTRSGQWLPGYLALVGEGLAENQPVVVRSKTFRDYLDRHYRVAPGRNKPYFDPLQRKRIYDNWPAGTFHSRAHNSHLVTQGVLTYEEIGDKRKWTVMGDPAHALRGYLEQDTIPIVEFAVWMLRGEAFEQDAGIEDVIERFKTNSKIPADQLAALFTLGGELETWPYDVALFTDEEWPADDCTDLFSPGVGTLGDTGFLDAVCAYLSDEARFEVEREFVAAFLTALRVEGFVVLAGKPGTGKTTFACLFTEALQQVLGDDWDIACIVHEVHEQTEEWELVGSRDLSGRYVPSDLMESLNQARDPVRFVRIVVLDEMNRALVDAYAGRFLSAVRYGVELPLPGDTENVSWTDGSWTPLPGVSVVACINSYMEEPGRHPLSGPIRRRGCVLDMPDPVLRLVADDVNGHSLFSGLCREKLLPQRAQALRQRGSPLAGEELQRLEADGSDEILDILWSLAKMLASDPLVPFTLGVIQDVLVFAVAHGGLQEGVDIALSVKVTRLLRGTTELLDRVESAVAAYQLPGFTQQLKQLRELADRNAGRVEPMY